MVRRISLIVLLGASLLLATAAPALAAKGGGGGGGSTGGASIALVMVTDKNANGLPNWGDQIKFAISTSYAYPIVSVSCYKGSTLVYGDSRPYYWPNLWDDPGIFTLSSLAWTGGAADCRADLKGMSKSGKTVVLASTSFHVAA